MGLYMIVGMGGEGGCGAVMREGRGRGLQPVASVKWWTTVR